MGQRKKILIVNNNERQLKAAKDVLRDEMFEIITHPCGFGVVALASEIQPDLVLLDASMPITSGDKLARLLRANNDTRHIKIVLCSSDGEDELRELASTCDVQGYICKTDIPDLKSKVHHYLGHVE